MNGTMLRQKGGSAQMLRLVVGLALGVLLTIIALGFGGIGHGSYVPLIFVNPLIASPISIPAVFTIVVGPVVWALYYFLIPRIPAMSVRLATILLVFIVHVLVGTWSAAHDPSFRQTVSENRAGLGTFAVILIASMGILLYFSRRRK